MADKNNKNIFSSVIKNGSGSAFLYVILILALLGSIILAFLSDTLNYVNYTSNYKYKNQSYYIAKSGTQMATFFISEYGSNPSTYREFLNKTSDYAEGFPVLGGEIKIEIINNDSKFNINQLIYSDNQINNVLYTQLQRLFYILGIPENILENTVSFMQTNQLSYEQLELKFNKPGAGLNGSGAGAGGSETAGGYLTNVTANQNISVLNTEYKNSFISVRDLMIVPKMKYKYYYILKQFLACNSSGLIDVNTAPYEVIESLSPMISSSAAKELVNYRVENPLTSAEGLSDVPGFNSSILESIVNEIETSSNFYLIKTTGIYKSGITVIRSLYYINGSKQKIYEFIN